MIEYEEFIEEEEKKPNAKCIICNTKYYVCGDCQDITEATVWRKIADTTTCYKIFMTIKQYLDENISKEEAKELLSNVDLSKLDTYADWVQFQIENIMK